MRNTNAIITVKTCLNLLLQNVQMNSSTKKFAHFEDCCFAWVFKETFNIKKQTYTYEYLFIAML